MDVTAALSRAAYFYAKKNGYFRQYLNSFCIYIMVLNDLGWFSYKIGALIDLDANGRPGVYPSDIRDSSLTKKYDDK